MVKEIIIENKKRLEKCSLCDNNYKDEYIDTVWGEVSMYNIAIIKIGRLKICDRCFDRLVKDFYCSYELYSFYDEKRKIEEEKYPKKESYKKQIIPNKLRWEVWKRDNFTCLNCGTRDGLSIDHIVSEIKGGKMEIDNLQTLCKNCNSKKRIKNIDYRKKK